MKQHYRVQLTLEQILSDMFYDVETNSMHSANRTLGNGLHISLYFNVDCSAVLSISREMVYPSQAEWETVCKNLPKEWKKPKDIKADIIESRPTLRAGLTKSDITQPPLFNP